MSALSAFRNLGCGVFVSIVAASLLIGPPALAADDRLAISVFPERSFAPSTLRMRIEVEPHVENRALEVVADSQDFFRRSVLQLDAEYAPRRFEFVFPNLPGGRYEIRAAIMDVGGDIRADVRHMVVVLP